MDLTWLHRCRWSRTSSVGRTWRSSLIRGPGGSTFRREAGWNFLGRHAALRHLAAWLADQHDLRTVVVTGDPGSGKSAVIGRVYILSHRDWRRAVPLQGLPADTIPPMGSIDVAIHARNRTSEEVLRALCSAANVTADTPGEFLRALSGKPMVAAIDAIDEAVDPDRLVSGILNPLIDTGPTVGFRMVLGTRSYILDRLSPAAERIDLDDPRYADPQSLRLYAESRLRAVAGSPYASADSGTVRAVAEAVAQAADRSFLVALITSRTLAARLHLADPTDSVWRASLPGTAAEAMHQDLEDRLGADAAKARDLLRPLAYARGNGLPWEDLWARLASLLAGRAYGDEALIWLRRHAGSYVVEALEGGRSVYRLYHAALAEYLRQGQDEGRIHCEFVSFLMAHVPRAATGERNWPEAHPYILSHLATHAAEGGELGSLVLDPGYLVCAGSAGLLAAFAAASDADTRLVAAAYERALHRLRSSDLAEGLAYLELAARRARAAALVERIDVYPIPRRWSVPWTRWPRDHPHRVLAGHHGPAREVVCIKNQDHGPEVASVGDDGTLRLWDLNTVEPLSVHHVSRSALRAIDVVEIPGSKQLVVVFSAIGSLMAYELTTMSCVLNVSTLSPSKRALQQLFQLYEPAMRCTRFPDGRSVAVTGGRGLRTAMWDLQTGNRIVKFPAGLRLSSLEFRQLTTGYPIVVGINEGNSLEEVFDVATGSRFPRGKAGMKYYCREDGTPVVAIRSSRYANRFTVFDLTRPSKVSTSKHSWYRNYVIQLNDGTRVKLPSESQGWLPDIPSEELIQLSDSLRNRSTHARSNEEFPFSVTLTGHTITLSSRGSRAHARGDLVLTGHSAPVTDVDVVTAPGEPIVFVSSSADSTVRAWDITQDLRATPSSDQGLDPSASVLATFTHEGRTLGLTITGAEKESIAILDLDTGRSITRLESRGSQVCAAACGWVPGVGNAAITYGTDGVVQIWRLPHGDKVAAFMADEDRWPVHLEYLSLTERPLAITCGHGNKAIIWDLADRRIHGVLGKHTGWTSALASGSSPGGMLVAVTGGCDNRINIWDPARGRRIGHLWIASSLSRLRDFHSGCAMVVSVTVIDDRFPVVLVLSEDGKVRLFFKRRRRPGYRRVTLGGYQMSGLAVMNLTDGRTLAIAGGLNGRLCAWDLEFVLAAAIRGQSKISALVEIETEVAITGLSCAGNNTIVTLTLNGLAAFRLHVDCLPRQKVEGTYSSRLQPLC